MKYTVGRQSNEARMSSIRLYAEEVVPRVRRLLAAD